MWVQTRQRGPHGQDLKLCPLPSTQPRPLCPSPVLCPGWGLFCPTSPKPCWPLSFLQSVLSMVTPAGESWERKERKCLSPTLCVSSVGVCQNEVLLHASCSTCLVQHGDSCGCGSCSALGALRWLSLGSSIPSWFSSPPTSPSSSLH